MRAIRDGGRAAAFNVFAAGVGLLLVLPLGGCHSTRTDRSSGRPMAGDDVPRSTQEARRLEQLGIEAVDDGQAETVLSRKQEKYDIALDYFRRAVTLYEDELASDPGTPEKQRNLDHEIDRLGDMIKRTHRDRPL